MMSERKPRWLSLISQRSQVAKRRISDIESENWSLSTIVFSEHRKKSPVQKRFASTACLSKLTNIHDFSISSDSETENYPNPENPALNKNQMFIQSESSFEEEILPKNQACKQGRKTFNHFDLPSSPPSPVDVPDQSHSYLHYQREDQVDFPLDSSSSEEENVGSVSQRKQKTKEPLSLFTFFSDIGRVEDGTKNCTKKPTSVGRLSSRLNLLLRRRKSERAIWLHTKSSLDSVFKNSHSACVFRAVCRLPFGFDTNPSAERICILACTLPSSSQDVDTTNVIIILDTCVLPDGLLSLLQSNQTVCSVNLILAGPWSEFRATHSTQYRIIIAPFFVTYKSVPSCSFGKEEKQSNISLVCDCIQKGGSAELTSLCKTRFGSKVVDPDQLEQSLFTNLTTSSFLVLHKSLFWFQQKLRYSFIVNFVGGFVALFLLPTSLFVCNDQCLQASHSGFSQLTPGCVYDTSKVPILSTSNDSVLSSQIQSLVASAKENIGPLLIFDAVDTELPKIPSCLLNSNSPSLQNAQVPLYLLKTKKLNFNLQYCQFPESHLSPPLSVTTSPCSRCTVSGIILYEFPMGSPIADKIINCVLGVNELFGPHLPVSATFVTLFILLLEKSSASGSIATNPRSCFAIGLAYRNAATPLQVVFSNLSPLPINYDQYRNFCSNVVIVGAVKANGFLIVDAFSRIEVTGMKQLTDSCEINFPCNLPPLEPLHIGPICAQLSVLSGRIIGVDSETSQVWPLCVSCLSEDLGEVPTQRTGILFECRRCRAKIERPYHAVEVIVEMQLGHISDYRRSQLSSDINFNYIKVCMMPRRIAKLLNISESQLQKASLIDPTRLLGLCIGNIPGILFAFPSFAGSSMIPSRDYFLLDLDDRLLDDVLFSPY